MKTKINLISVIVVLLMFSFRSKAQYTFTNSLNCDVTIFYEIWRPTAPCSVCMSGSITINQNSTQSITPCSGYCEICIIIMDIGGTSIGMNHSTLNCCHVLTPGPYGQTGTDCGGWTATQGTSGWIIQ